MTYRMRGIAIAILAVGAWLVAGTASALTVSPTGSYAAVSGTTTWTQASNAQAMTCSSSSLGLTLAADGTGLIPARSATFLNCRNALLGAWTIVQTVDWPVATQLRTSPLGVDIVWTSPTDGLQVTLSGCTFWLAGTITLTQSLAALPGILRSIVPVGSSALRITRNNGGPLCFSFPVGLAMSYRATYDFNRAITVSG